MCRYGWSIFDWNTWRVSGRYQWTISSEYASTPRGEIEIELPRARLLVHGPVDLAVLERVLASLSR